MVNPKEPVEKPGFFMHTGFLTHYYSLFPIP
jgi:hypothetical protein